jgi:hypothetical protein
MIPDSRAKPRRARRSTHGIARYSGNCQTSANYCITNRARDEKRYSKPEAMVGHSSGHPLLCLLRMPIDRAAHLYLCRKKDSIVYLAGHFGGGIFLAGGNHPGPRGDSQVSKLRLAKPALRMAKKNLEMRRPKKRSNRSRKRSDESAFFREMGLQKKGSGPKWLNLYFPSFLP